MQFPSPETQESLNFQGYWLSIKRRWLPFAIVSASVLGCAAVATHLQKPIYEAEGQLLLSKTDRVSSLTDIANQVKEVTGLTQTSSPLDTEAILLQSPPILEKTIATLNLKDKEGQLLDSDQFKKSLKVKSIRGTDVLSVSYRSIKPTEVAAVVNTLMKLYLESNIRVNRTATVAARDFIRRQLPEIEARVQAAEADLRQFKEANRVVALEEEAKVAVKGTSDLADAITRSKADLADATSRSMALQQQIGLTPTQAIAFTTLSQSVAVQKVLAEYQQVQDQLAVQRTRYRPEHPEIITLLRKEEALKQQLEGRIAQVLQGAETVTNQDLQITSLKQAITQDLVKAEAERVGLASRAAVLDQAMTNYQSRASVLPQLEQKQRELERRLQIARSTYEQLLKRLQEVELAENQNIGNVRIVAAARVPQKAIASSKLLNLALGGVMGILAGALMALMLDAIDKSVKTVDEAQKLAGYPLLGIIPLMGGKNGDRNRDQRIVLPARDNPCSFIGTSFEMLQTSLGFTVSDHPLQVILVTSAVSGEGKSFIAANLAIATAQMGRRVLLIDADMRQPSQHRIWQQMNLKGLSDILVDQANFPEIISSPYANLNVLTSGTTPPNPIALIDSKRLASLIKTVTDAYDFIIFDTPALTLAPDALTLGKLVDGILFVVRPGVADSASVKQARFLLAQSGQRVLGMVINGSASGRGNAKSYSVRETRRWFAPATTSSTEEVVHSRKL